MSILCRLGFHKFFDDWGGVYPLNIYCVRCPYAHSGWPAEPNHLPWLQRKFFHDIGMKRPR